MKRRIAINTGFKEFESAQRALAGIEIVSIIRKKQIEKSIENLLVKLNNEGMGIRSISRIP
ncbi:hypothetical protein HNS40_17445 [Lentimicrobium sp. S6]|nr:hypothetical protein [Lentimicrobium sp. S6]